MKFVWKKVTSPRGSLSVGKVFYFLFPKGVAVLAIRFVWFVYIRMIRFAARVWRMMSKEAEYNVQLFHSRLQSTWSNNFCFSVRVFLSFSRYRFVLFFLLPRNGEIFSQTATTSRQFSIVWDVLQNCSLWSSIRISLLKKCGIHISEIRIESSGLPRLVKC